MKTKVLSTALCLSMVAGAAAAVIAEIDVNSDGMYSFPEVLAVMPDFTDADFAALDANGDGLLDGDEIAAAVEAGMLPASEG